MSSFGGYYCWEKHCIIHLHYWTFTHRTDRKCFSLSAYYSSHIIINSCQRLHACHIVKLNQVIRFYFIVILNLPYHSISLPYQYIWNWLWWLTCLHESLLFLNMYISTPYLQYQGKLNIRKISSKRVRNIPAWPRRHARRMHTGVLRHGIGYMITPLYLGKVGKECLKIGSKWNTVNIVKCSSATNIVKRSSATAPSILCLCQWK